MQDRAYQPGRSMRRIANLYPGEAKSDARDAAVIADAVRTMPHTLRSLDLTDKITAELTVLVGFDQDLAAEATAPMTRLPHLESRPRWFRRRPIDSWGTSPDGPLRSVHQVRSSDACPSDGERIARGLSGSPAGLRGLNVGSRHTGSPDRTFCRHQVTVGDQHADASDRDAR